MNRVRFTLALAAEHALLADAVFARASVSVSADRLLEFEDGRGYDETRVVCSCSMATFLLKEMHRIAAMTETDAEVSFALTESAIAVRRAIAAEAGSRGGIE